MLKDRLLAQMQTVDALTLRERLFVLAAVLAVMGGAWEAFLAGPLEAHETSVGQRIEQAHERLEQLDSSVVIAAEGIGGGMGAGLERLESLRRQVSSGEETLRTSASSLVGPDQMRFVLEDLIERQRGLELVRARNLESQPLIESEEPDEAPPGEEGPMLYLHGLRIELEGTYLDCLAYLESVEALPWQIHWTGLQLRTLEHPRIQIVLELHTLSFDEGWIGV